MLSSCVWRGKHNSMSTVRVCYFPQGRGDFHFFWIKGFPNHWLCVSPDHMDHLSVHQQRLQPGVFSWLQALEQLLLPGPPRACKQCLSSCWIWRRKRGRGDWVLWISVVPITKVSRVAASRSVLRKGWHCTDLQKYFTLRLLLHFSREIHFQLPVLTSFSTDRTMYLTQYQDWYDP